MGVAADLLLFFLPSSSFLFFSFFFWVKSFSFSEENK